ncbi:hypothetical protein [Halorussus pelagicus]|uniref:hypothetical protein n=1 Tax=Halorussus pelagicus TaxID=2505977 RepID=UPI000FFC1449|nr:hypothetical protein [Halorussus pelagicus]
MSFRRPEARHFPLSLGVLVGLGGYLATPGPWPTDPVLSLGLGACICVVVWTAVEQKPDALDRAVEARAYLLVGGLGLLAVIGVAAPTLVHGTTMGDGKSIRLLVFICGIAVAVALGNSHRGKLLLERQRVRASVAAVEPQRWEFGLSVVGSAALISVLGLVMGDSFSVTSFVGTLLGLTIGNAFTGTTDRELVALEDHLLIRQTGNRGGTAIPWRRLRDVTIEDDTLRVARGLPYPTVYTADLSEVEDAHAAREAFRSYPYLH